MAYSYRFYRFASLTGFAAAWAVAGLPLSAEGTPVLSGGAIDQVGSVATPTDPPVPIDGWHVNVAWTIDPPASLETYAIAPFEGLRVYAGWSDAAPPAPVPSQVYNFQARAVLMQMPGPGGGSLFDAIDTAIAQAGGIEWQAWEYATVFDRASPLIAGLAAGFGLSTEDIDQLFITAAGISA